MNTHERLERDQLLKLCWGLIHAEQAKQAIDYTDEREDLIDSLYFELIYLENRYSN